MRRFVPLCMMAFALLIVMGACDKSQLTAEHIQQALQKQGLEVTPINVANTELNGGDSLQLEGVFPEAFELTLPAADMAYREFLFVYVYPTAEASQAAAQSDGISLLRMADLHPNVRKKENVVVIYWSHHKETPLMMNPFTKAMDE